eukprot:120934-Rhodomonas_salina.4
MALEVAVSERRDDGGAEHGGLNRAGCVAPQHGVEALPSRHLQGPCQSGITADFRASQALIRRPSDDVYTCSGCGELRCVCDG